VFLNMLVERMGAVGVPIIGSDGSAVAAISIAALSDRLSARMDQLVGMLKREAEAIGNPKRT
jgi:DNA-binding IclR family transcriptional regulator